MFSFSLGQGLILVDISWDYGWKLCEKKKKSDAWWKEFAKGERKKKKRKEKCCIVFLKF